MGDVKEMCSLLNDYNRFPYDIESFNSKFTWTYPFNLEHIFVKLTENTDCLLINSYFKDFFKAETKNLSSFVDIVSNILTDHDDNFYIVLSNHNKINTRMIITFNNKVIFDNYVFGTMLPACKIDQEGEYIIDSYDMNNTLIKTDKLLYQFKYQENYKNTGYIKESEHLLRRNFDNRWLNPTLVSEQAKAAEQLRPKMDDIRMYYHT
jgi:hypothetical protein